MRAARHVGVVLVLALFPGLAWGACGDSAGHAQALAEARAAVEIECPCGAATDRGGYRRCVGQALQRRIARLQLPASCAATVLKCAVRSTCGRPGFVACCGMKRGRCRAVRDAARCVRRGGTPGRWASCCDACTPAPEVAFSTAACPSHYAPAACAAGTATIDAEPWDRPVPAMWSVLAREGDTSTLVAFRNTGPAEPGAT
jgi:hypothetical protein